MPAYERLSFLDNSFLALESRTTHMHVGAVTIIEADTLRTPDGGVDVDAIRRYLAGRIHAIPRYRQVLARLPIERHPIWVDDQHFSIDYHVRHTSLPAPGSFKQLNLLAGRVFSQQLDREKPLWELWIVEGLENDRFAIISKIHHCMIDGMGGVDLMALLMNFGPSDHIDEPRPWEPRPVPTGAELLVGETARRARRMFSAMSDIRNLPDEAADVVGGVAQRVLAAANALNSGWLTSASRTPITQPIGPNRRFGNADIPLAQVKQIKNVLGGTVNDVVLAIVAGALRRFFLEVRDFTLDDVDFRVMAPVSVRSEQANGGNQIAMWLLPLPLADADPVSRLRTIQTETEHLKVTNQALGASTLVSVSSGAPGTLVSLASRLATRVRPFNMTVTNVPGPQIPLYLLDAKLHATYPLVPLWNNHGLGVAIFSYAGSLQWGLNADWDLMPDLDDFEAALVAAADELTAAAEAKAAAPAAKKAPVAKKRPVTKAAAEKKAPVSKATAEQKAAPVARKPVAKKPVAKKAPVSKATAEKKAAPATKKPAPKKTVRKPVPKASATASPAKKPVAAKRKPASKPSPTTTD